MKKLWIAPLLAVLLMMPTRQVPGRQDQPPDQPSKNEGRQPEITGVTQGNTGCAVIEKHTPVKGKLLALGVVYARTQYVVVDTFHCTLPKQKFTGPADIKDLNQIAAQNKIKLVVIHTNYTDEELQQAKDICQGKIPLRHPAPSSP